MGFILLGYLHASWVRILRVYTAQTHASMTSKTLINTYIDENLK